MSDAMIHRAPLSIKLSTAHFAFLFCIWLIVANWKLADLPIGIAAAALALWISLTLWPRHSVNLRPASFARLTLRLLGCSILAGVDVARRALLPRLDLRPGFIVAPLTLQSGGMTRDVFLLYQSLQPGTLPTGVEGDHLEVHSLDISQPVVDAIEADEALFKRAIGRE
jgi:multicomponent Na+:H+ antiporter subunit E